MLYLYNLINQKSAFTLKQALRKFCANPFIQQADLYLHQSIKLHFNSSIVFLVNVVLAQFGVVSSPTECYNSRYHHTEWYGYGILEFNVPLNTV